MFARASIASGLFQRQCTRYSLASGLLLGGGGGARPRKKRRKFTFYVPFMWPAMALTLGGAVMIVGGVTMCIYGYFADSETQRHAYWERQEEERMTTADDDTSVQYPYYNYSLRYLIYVGPVLMAIGCFLIVIASVVVCETRDRILDILERQKLSQVLSSSGPPPHPPPPPPQKPKPDFFRLVVGIGLPPSRRSRALSFAENDLELCREVDERSTAGHVNDVIDDYSDARCDVIIETGAEALTVDEGSRIGRSSAEVRRWASMVEASTCTGTETEAGSLGTRRQEPWTPGGGRPGPSAAAGTLSPHPAPIDPAASDSIDRSSLVMNPTTDRRIELKLQGDETTKELQQEQDREE